MPSARRRSLELQSATGDAQQDVHHLFEATLLRWAPKIIEACLLSGLGVDETNEAVRRFGDDLRDLALSSMEAANMVARSTVHDFASKIRP